MMVRNESTSGCTQGASRGLMVLTLLCSAAVFGAVGCGGSTAAGPGAKSDLKLSQTDFGAQFDRSRCNDHGKQVVTADTNGDGKPDVVKLFTVAEQNGQKVQQLSCRQVDLNHDGKMDIIYSYNDAGTLIGEEFDLDFDGKFDERVYYQDGKKVRMERDMDGDGRPDYLEFYEGGRLVRVERDSNADGRVDEWQYYENGKLDRIGIDTTGSGRADKWERNPENAESAAEAVPPAGTTPAAKDAPAPAAAKAPAGAGETPAKKTSSK